MAQPDNAGKTPPTINEYMARNVKTISVDATLKELSQSIINQGVSALIVTEGADYVGIVSDKRLARAGIAMGLNIETATVELPKTFLPSSVTWAYG